ncbi:MAG: type II toxin-antitoxin system RelE/ParE family toxin [Acidobacteria bacterium]|nr:type II toxin-antitoxin system RelE/ParE family toxin [Acidobacteriota bacterium]
MIRWTNRAIKDMESLPPNFQARMNAIVAELDSNPARRGTKLKGKLAGKWSVRLGRSHRIIYKIDEDADIVVLTVRPRKDAYR